MKTCPRCGMRNELDAVYCKRCGYPKERKKTYRKPGWLTWILVGVVVILAVILIVLLIQLLDQTKPQVPEDEPGITAALPADTEVDTEELDIYYVTGTEVFVSLRSQADTATSRILAKLMNGEKVGLIQAENDEDWYVYSYTADCTGYVRSHFLTKDEAAVTAALSYYAAQTVKLKDRAGTEREEIPAGAQLTVLSCPVGEDWYVYCPATDSFGLVPQSALSLTQPQVEEQAATQVQAPQLRIGEGDPPGSHLGVFYVAGVNTYLALRNAAGYDPANEIGEVHNGEAVWALVNGGGYWHVYVPKLGMYGYVNSEYLTKTQPGIQQEQADNVYYVTGVSSYLALRTACEYDSANEIAQLRNGEAVEFQYEGENGYWYVYAPSCGLSGYVNRDYLTQ